MALHHNPYSHRPERYMEENAHQGDDERPHFEPAFQGADGHDPAAVVTQIPNPPGAIPARDHRAPSRADSPPGRVRLSDELPRPLQAVSRHQSSRLPARLPEFADPLTTEFVLRIESCPPGQGKVSTIRSQTLSPVQ